MDPPNCILDTDFLHIVSKNLSGENILPWRIGQEANYTQTHQTVIWKVYPSGREKGKIPSHNIPFFSIKSALIGFIELLTASVKSFFLSNANLSESVMFPKQGFKVKSFSTVG